MLLRLLFNNKPGWGALMVLLVFLASVQCTKRPGPRELEALSAECAAARAVEQTLQELQKEKKDLEHTLAEKKEELRDLQQKRDALREGLEEGLDY